MMRELKLPVFAGHGAEKQLEYLVMFFLMYHFKILLKAVLMPIRTSQDIQQLILITQR